MGVASTDEHSSATKRKHQWSRRISRQARVKEKETPPFHKSGPSVLTTPTPIRTRTQWAWLQIHVARHEELAALTSQSPT
eukprot:10293338-Karenia_brevis.AAC.1